MMASRESISEQSPEAHVRALVEEILESTGLYLVDVNVRGRKGSQVVEVYVDGDEGVGLDQLAEISRELGFLLDTEDVIKGKYNLNVSSPGVDRPLVQPRQYRRNVGRPVQVRLRAAEGERPQTFEGTLAEATDDHIVVEVGRRGPHEIAYDDIDHAKILLPW